MTPVLCEFLQGEVHFSKEEVLNLKTETDIDCSDGCVDKLC
jgi:hypothetical protein